MVVYKVEPAHDGKWRLIREWRTPPTTEFEIVAIYNTRDAALDAKEQHEKPNLGAWEW